MQTRTGRTPGWTPGAASLSSREIEARALGVSTRFRIFEHLAGTPHPIAVAELTELLGLNHNAIRQHLAVLRDAGLVIEAGEQRKPVGRPRVLYTLSRKGRDSLGTPGPYEELAQLLSETISSGSNPRQVGRQAGRRRARHTAGGAGDVLATIRTELAADGFDPGEPISAGQRTVFVLRRCPYVTVAAADPATICDLHLGLAEGIASGFGEHVAVDLVAKNPVTAGCRLGIAIQSAGGTANPPQ
ncbi:MAG: helix-turn-helix domain-containing protein [Thermoleophilia bacterium]